MLTYKRKLILTKEQEQRVDSWINTCRFVYNMALEIRIAAWRNKQQRIHRFDLIKQLTTIKDIDWIEDVCAQTLQDSIERLDKAYQAFFKQGSGFPRFKSKKDYNSITFKTVRVVKGRIKLPKIGFVKHFKDAEIIGEPRCAYLKKEVNGYFICIVCKDVQRSIQNSDESQVVGLDMGVANLCIDSNGCIIENPRITKKYEAELRVANRSLSRKRKGSNNWYKQIILIKKLHNKISNVRKDYLHKTSTDLAKKYHTVIIENLNVAGMVKSRRLAKHISDCAWGEFRRMLEYKTSVIAIEPNHTSQRCSDCGAIDANSRISQSEFVCTSCGAVSHADINAAKNILSKGMAHVRERKALV